MTAQEFLDDNFESECYAGDVYADFAYPNNTVISAMIEFARTKVKEALEAAADNVYMKKEESYTGGLKGDGLLYETVEVVDKDSILNAYDLNSIV